MIDIESYVKDLIQQGISPCERCGDYEYCAGHFDDDKCTGFIPK